MSDMLSADDFVPFVGKTFQMAGHPQSLTLHTVDSMKQPNWPATLRKPFSLILRGPYGHVVPEGMHRVTVDGRREFDLYIIPIQTASRDYQEYQIVFN